MLARYRMFAGYNACPCDMLGRGSSDVQAQKQNARKAALNAC
jgi:hypothetical protein